MRCFLIALVVAVGVVEVATPAAADIVQTSQCRADLARAHRLIGDIRARENTVARGDIAGLCVLLRRNRSDMAEAGKLMDRCMSGHERGENVGQIMASLGDINLVLQRRCN